MTTAKPNSVQESFDFGKLRTDFERVQNGYVNFFVSIFVRDASVYIHTFE